MYNVWPKVALFTYFLPSVQNINYLFAYIFILLSPLCLFMAYQLRETHYQIYSVNSLSATRLDKL